jgi:hypothetical protein
MKNKKETKLWDEILMLWPDAMEYEDIPVFLKTRRGWRPWKKN